MTYFESIYRFFGWWFINIDIFLLTILLGGVIIFFFQKKKCGTRLILLSSFGLLFFGVIPIGLWSLEYLENRFPKIESLPPDVKGIILLGGSFDQWTTLGRGETAYNLAAGRFIQFINLAKEHPHFQRVFTGNAFEEETAKKEFKLLGLDPASIIFEGASKDTRTNAEKTAQLINPQPGEKWVLVTSAFHMPRSVGLFRKAGFDVIPYPVDYHTPGKYERWFFLGLKLNLEAWQASAREWLGMLINYLMGRSDEFVPHPSAGSF